MKRKGFTLIELLAVIVILAVIALIATPLVMNIIEESRKSSFRVSVENMIRAMENDQAIQGYISLSYEFPLTSDTTLGLKGDIDNWQGKSSIDEDGNTAVSIYNGTYCAYKKKDDNSVSVEKVSSEEECLDFTNPILPIIASVKGYQMATSSFLDGPIKRETIESVRISNTVAVPGTVIGDWDVSENQDESVIAYYSDNDNDGLYEVVIGGEGGVAANPNSSSLFSQLRNATTIDVRYLDTSNVTDMSYLFNVCSNLTTLDVSKFDTSNVTKMNEMFGYCSGLTTLDVRNFNTSKVTDMRAMFYGCSSLKNLDVSKFKTSNVTDMSFMFRSCSGLTTLNVSKFDTSNVTTMSSMFRDCIGLTNLDLKTFDTSKVRMMDSMFENCSNLTELNLSEFDTSDVTSMSNMFYGCSSLQDLDLSSFNTSQVIYMSSMFLNCVNLKTLYLHNMTFDRVTSYANMFSNITSGITVTVKDSSAKTFIESRLSEASVTGTVTIAS